MRMFKSMQLAYFSTPKEDRVVYQTIQHLEAKRLLEIGLQRGKRSKRMVEAAAMSHDVHDLEYFGVDPFEGRSEIDGPGWSLKRAHAELTALGLKVRLLPGEPGMAISRVANTIRDIEVAVIATPRNEWLDAAWTYISRMLSDRATVLVGTSLAPGGPFEFEALSAADVRAKASSRRAA